MKHENPEQTKTKKTPSLHAAGPGPAKRRQAAVPRALPAVDATDARVDLIRETAYAFYEARGRGAGHDLDDWLEAEAQVGRATQAEPVESVVSDSSEP